MTREEAIFHLKQFKKRLHLDDTEEYIINTDSIDMAINAQKDEEHKKGIELVKKAFMDALKKFDVEEIDAQGDFDPKLHEAVMSKEDPDNAGKIVQVLRAGYKRGDKILRHTMCVVGQ